MFELDIFNLMCSVDGWVGRCVCLLTCMYCDWLVLGRG